MIDLNMTVDEVITSKPRLAILFARHHMICVGCDIARFHTLREAALMYHLDPDLLINEMRQMERESQIAPSTTKPSPPPA